MSRDPSHYCAAKLVVSVQAAANVREGDASQIKQRRIAYISEARTSSTSNLALVFFIYDTVALKRASDPIIP